MASIAEIQSQIAALQDEIALLNTQLIAASQANDVALVAQITQQIDADRTQLTRLFSQLQAAASPTDSAGQVAATDDAANTQNPATSAQVLTLTGRIDTNNVETGTDAPVRTTEQTQATPPNPLKITADDNGGAWAPTEPGVSAPKDDGAVTTKNTTVSGVDNLFNESKIIPQSNVLDQYASYTYQASVYLMKPETFNAMVKNRTKSLNGAQLLFQSGGAPVGGRNPYFSNDYYIDKIELKSNITGKGTNAAHNVNAIRMTVIEPNGIT